MMISTHFIEVIMNIENIKRKLNPILERESLKLYRIKQKKEFGENILEILIDGQRIDTSVLESIHLELYHQLTDDDIDPNYFLELSSVGIERPIQTEEDFLNAVGKYIYLETQHYQGNATLLEKNSDILKIEINLKGRMKKIEIRMSEIKNCRHAVKF